MNRGHSRNKGMPFFQHRFNGRYFKVSIGSPPKLRGSKRYCANIPCIIGHPDRRYRSSFWSGFPAGPVYRSSVRGQWRGHKREGGGNGWRDEGRGRGGGGRWERRINQRQRRSRGYRQCRRLGCTFFSKRWCACVAAAIPTASKQQHQGQSRNQQPTDIRHERLLVPEYEHWCETTCWYRKRILFQLVFRLSVLRSDTRPKPPICQMDVVRNQVHP